jgi:hypothetical protein
MCASFFLRSNENFLVMCASFLVLQDVLIGPELRDSIDLV